MPPWRPTPRPPPAADPEIGAALDAGRAEAAMTWDEAAGDAAAELMIVYTSGTTGKAEGAVLAQPAMIANAVMSRHAYAADGG